MSIHATYAQHDPQQAVIAETLQHPQSLHACPATSAATVALASQSALNHASFSSALEQAAWLCSGGRAAGAQSASTQALTGSGGTTVTVCRDDRALIATGRQSRMLNASSTEASALSSSGEVDEGTPPGAAPSNGVEKGQLQEPGQQQIAQLPPSVPAVVSQELRGAGEESHLFVLELVPTPAYWMTAHSGLQPLAESSGECSAAGECAAGWDHVYSSEGGAPGRGALGVGKDFTSRFTACTHTLLPWFVQPWFHTLQVYVDGQLRPLSEVLQPQLHIAST